MERPVPFAFAAVFVMIAAIAPRSEAGTNIKLVVASQQGATKAAAAPTTQKGGKAACRKTPDAAKPTTKAGR